MFVLIELRSTYYCDIYCNAKMKRRLLVNLSSISGLFNYLLNLIISVTRVFDDTPSAGFKNILLPPTKSIQRKVLIKVDNLIFLLPCVKLFCRCVQCNVLLTEFASRTAAVRGCRLLGAGRGFNRMLSFGFP